MGRGRRLVYTKIAQLHLVLLFALVMCVYVHVLCHVPHANEQHGKYRAVCISLRGGCEWLVEPRRPPHWPPT